MADTTEAKMTGGAEKRAYVLMPDGGPPACVSATSNGSPVISHLSKGGRFSGHWESCEHFILLGEDGTDCRAMVPYRPVSQTLRGKAGSGRLSAGEIPRSRRLPALLALPPCMVDFSIGIAGARDHGSGVSLPREIPSEVFPVVFQYMDAPTLCSVSGVSREWRKQGNDDRYWGRLCRSRFNVTPDAFAPPPDPIKRLYQMQYGSLRAMRRGCHQMYQSAPPSLSAHTSAQILMGLLAANAV